MFKKEDATGQVNHIKHRERDIGAKCFWINNDSREESSMGLKVSIEIGGGSTWGRSLTVKRIFLICNPLHGEFLQEARGVNHEANYQIK
jgi:hypothetical protein